MRILHSADWQFGAPFLQFGARASLLKEARPRTLKRVLEFARDREVDALLIAGDLFEDHQIEQSLIAQVFALLAADSSVPIFILPGNHDPIGNPGAIWARAPFSNPPAHLTIFSKPEAIPLADGWLIAQPLTQKKSATDPTAKIAEIARSLPSGEIKVGLAHGSPAIASMHQPDDFPIPLDAATRAGLDYLALGHWHGAMTLDGGRIQMAGTPERTSHDEGEAGYVHEIEITAAGALPKITRIRSAELDWVQHTWELGSADATPERIEAALAAIDQNAPTTIARLTLRGLASPTQSSALREQLHARTSAFAFCEIRDETAPDLSAAELKELLQTHPLLGEVLTDLDALEGGSFPQTERAKLEELAACSPGTLDGAMLAEARRLLARELRETQPSW